MYALPYAVTGLMGSLAGGLLAMFFLILLAIPYIAYNIGIGIGLLIGTSYVLYVLIPSLLFMMAYYDWLGTINWLFFAELGEAGDGQNILNFVCIIAMCLGMIKESRINFFDSLQTKQFPSARAYNAYALRGDMIVVFCVLSLVLTWAFCRFDGPNIISEFFNMGISTIEATLGDTMIFKGLEYAYWFVVDVCWFVYDWIKYDLFS